MTCQVRGVPLKILINGLDEYYSEKVRVVRTVMKRESAEEHPELIKWALQALYFHGEEWIEICRIDNYLHEGLTGSHIHIFPAEVRRMNITYEDAREEIKKIIKRILREKFGEDFEVQK